MSYFGWIVLIIIVALVIYYQLHESVINNCVRTIEGFNSGATGQIAQRIKNLPPDRQHRVIEQISRLPLITLIKDNLEDDEVDDFIMGLRHV